MVLSLSYDEARLSDDWNPYPTLAIGEDTWWREADHLPWGWGVGSPSCSIVPEAQLLAAR